MGFFSFFYDRFSYPGVACSKKVGNQPAREIIITTEERSKSDKEETSTPIESGSGSEVSKNTNVTAITELKN